MNILNKEEILIYYKNHTLKEIDNYFNTSFYNMKIIIERWNIKKHSISYNHELGCLRKYGVKHTSELEEIKNKISNGLNSLSDEEKIKRSNKISNSLNNKSDEEKKERLEKIFNYNCHNSKPNKNFSRILENNSIKYKREFVLGSYVYDFKNIKIDDILIEINPSITYNINIAYRKGKIKGKDYHFKNQIMLLKKGIKY